MVSAKVKVINPQGLHMRPAQLFATEASRYPCGVTVVFGGAAVDSKSAMNLMALRVRQGSVIEIRCDGPREAEALAAATALVESGLGDI